MITVGAPKHSFVQFFQEQYETQSATVVHFKLPVMYAEDVAFQVLAQGLNKGEVDAVFGGSPALGIVRNIGGPVVLDLAAGSPWDKYRGGDLQASFNWPHGFPGFEAVINENECFHLKLVVQTPQGPLTYYSVPFERIYTERWTTLVQYGSRDNAFGFNYCGVGVVDVGGIGGVVDEDNNSNAMCEPTIVQFNNVSNINYNYTAALKALYGNVPTVAIYIQDPDTGEYVRSVIRAGFDNYPPTKIIADLGGPATGFFKIS